MKNICYILLAICLIGVSCERYEPQPIDDSNLAEPLIMVDENLYQTWVLVEKEVNGTKEALPEDDVYPITLTFYPEIFTFFQDIYYNARGRCDANTYEVMYETNGNAISLRHVSITDCGGTKWYWDYLQEINAMDTFALQCENADKMQLRLSNMDGSIVLHFINRKWFEETYFELDKLYNF